MDGRGGALETGEGAPEPGDVTVRHDDLYAGALPTLTAEQVATAGTLLDARAPERFRGDVEPIDPVRGPHSRSPQRAEHRPAGRRRHVPWGSTDLARLFDGIGEVGAYCGSGVTASVVVAALASVGVDAALYPGSWSEWCSEPTRPVETG